MSPVDYTLVNTRLTELVHERVGDVLQEGDTAIDATAGNGYDTVFLSERVGRSGRVFALDVQEPAIAATRRRLREGIMAEWNNTRVIHGCHSNLLDLLPDVEHGTVSAIVFNLGYLPGGDHAVTTHRVTTELALRSALLLLKPGGIVTVLVYIGHERGSEELQLLTDISSEVLAVDGATCVWESFQSKSSINNVPRLFVARRS